MRKNVEGVLARDDRDSVYVYFYEGAVMRGMSLSDIGLWRRRGKKGWTKSWSVAQWRSEYKLEPPEKGFAFEVVLDLD